MRRRGSQLAIVLTMLFAGAILSHSQNSPRALVVIVNKNNPVNDLSANELRRIFLGERKFWTGSRKIIVLMRNDGSVERQKALRFLQMSELNYKKHWLQKINSGDADAAPVALPANGTAVSLVSGSDNAIAFIPLADLKDSVKVVKIDGHSPNDPAYPLP